jgi:hypothetical protein
MIDIHTHIGRVGLTPKAWLDDTELLRQMDSHGIEKAVLLPLGMTPECVAFRGDTEAALEAYGRHPDRIIPFCNLDPRSGNSPEADFSWVLSEYKAAGCRGLGELTANLPFDDPLCMNLYRHCGRAGLPVLFHLAEAVRYGLYGVADERGLPRLERVLQACPETVFIGHAMAFWAEIASTVDEETRGGYPAGPVAGPGRTVELLQRYTNLYGDLSAMSGFNAISREPEFGYWFLEALQDKLLFGTDIAEPNQADVKIVAYLNQARDQGRISEGCYHKVARRNAERLLGLSGV